MLYFTTENCICISNESAAIARCKALERCYSIPGYKELPLEYKNIIYDYIIAKIERESEV